MAGYRDTRAHQQRAQQPRVSNVSTAPAVRIERTSLRFFKTCRMASGDPPNRSTRCWFSLYGSSATSFIARQCAATMVADLYPRVRELAAGKHEHRELVELGLYLYLRRRARGNVARHWRSAHRFTAYGVAGKAKAQCGRVDNARSREEWRRSRLREGTGLRPEPAGECLPFRPATVAA